jgi:hypothetical protein
VVAPRDEADSGGLAIHEGPESSPALVYRHSLVPGSRPAMTSALRTCVGLLGYEGDVFAFP